MSHDITNAPMSHGHPVPDHADAHFKAYIKVFIALCVCTALSFIVNQILGENVTSAAIILLVSCVKATLVGYIFMHLAADWGKVYGIIIPVAVMALMMAIVLMPDIVLGWHYGFQST